MTAERVIERSSRLVGMADLLDKCRHNPQEILANCRDCPRFGKTWSCPPFDYDPAERLTRFRSASIYLSKIHTLPSDTDYFTPLAPERARILSFITREQALHPGSFYLGLAGECTRCSSCTRTHGHPCRRPDDLHPSLEAWGFDVTAISSRMMDTRIIWGAGM